MGNLCNFILISITFIFSECIQVTDDCAYIPLENGEFQQISLTAAAAAAAV
jgi:hypothetical protein